MGFLKLRVTSRWMTSYFDKATERNERTRQTYNFRLTSIISLFFLFATIFFGEANLPSFGNDCVVSLRKFHSGVCTFITLVFRNMLIFVSFFISILYLDFFVIFIFSMLVGCMKNF